MTRTPNNFGVGTYEQGLIIADGKDVCTSMDGIPHHPVRSIVDYDSNTMLVGVDGFGVYQASRLPSAKNKASLLFNANEGEHGVLHGNGIYAVLVDALERHIHRFLFGRHRHARPRR